MLDVGCWTRNDRSGSASRHTIFGSHARDGAISHIAVRERGTIQRGLGGVGGSTDDLDRPDFGPRAGMADAVRHWAEWVRLVEVSTLPGRWDRWRGNRGTVQWTTSLEDPDRLDFCRTNRMVDVPQTARRTRHLASKRTWEQSRLQTFNGSFMHRTNTRSPAQPSDHRSFGRTGEHGLFQTQLGLPASRRIPLAV